MTSDNKSYIATNEVILSAKEAANLLQCTPDYITKLAREGKLDGTQNGKGWQVTHSSLKRYEATRDSQKAERSKDLAEERRRELVASTPTSLKHVYVALMLSLVFGAATFSLASVIKHDVAGIQTASLSRVESPFFASFDLGGVVGSMRDAVARLFAPSTILSPLANQNISAPNTATTTIVNNYTTTPVVERIVERVAPADAATLTVNFSDWANAFETRFELQVNRIFDVIGDLETGGGGISTITDADVPDTITASNYLPLAGGTLTGDLFGTTATFDSILVTDATSTNATTTNFWLLGAAEGCAQFDTNGKLTSTGTNCGSGGGGADGNWVYFNGSGIRLATTSVQVVIGATATSSDSKVQIVGGLTLDNSTTTNATTTTFGITALQNALLGTNAEGSVIATTSLSISQYLTGILPVANGGTGASSLTSGQLLYGAGTGAVQSVATGTVSSGAGISVTAGQYIIGSGLTITNTGVTSLAGTANQITASAATGAITLSLPDHVIFPGTFQASAASTTNATSTNLTVTGIASTTALYISNVANAILSTSNGGAVAATTVSAPLAFSGNTLSITQATASTDGYLSSAHWNLFNNKVSSTSLETFASTYRDWNIVGDALVPTSTIGVIISASSTINSLTTINSTSTNATTTNLSVSGIASTTSLTISGLGNGSTQCLEINGSGTVSGTGTACGAGGGGGSDPFPSNATSTLLTFSGGLISQASSTIYALNTINSTSTNATTTNLAISSVLSSLLKTSSTGVVSAAIAGTDYLATYDAWTHPDAGVSATTSGLIISASSTIDSLTTRNSTTTNLVVTGGLLSTASTTIVDGSASLQVSNSGGVRLGYSGYELFLGMNSYLTLAGANPYVRSTDGILQLEATDGNGAVTLTAGSTEVLRATSAGNIGIGTTSPASKLSVVGASYLAGHVLATSTVTLSNYLGGALATDATGALYTFSTSTWSFASSTLLADNNQWSGGNIFAGSTTINSLTAVNATSTNATTTNLAITGALTFNGVTATTWAGFCSTITGSADLCDGVDATGGGGGGTDVNWTFFNGSGLRPSTSTNQVLIGGTATTSLESPLAKLGVFGGASIDYASTTGITASYASTTNLVAGNLTVGTLTGLLKAASGVVSAAVAGTDYLVSYDAWTHPDTGVSATTSGLIISASSTINSLTTINSTSTNATTTNLAVSGIASTTALVISNVPSGILKTSSGGVVSAAVAGTDYIANTAGDWAGTFDGEEGTYYLDRANHSGTQLASTISDFNAAVNSYIHGSSTIAKTYTANTFTLHNIFESLFATNASTTNATTTNFAITALQNALLATNADGSVIATTSLAIAQYLTGVLPVANGGTGASSFTSGQLLYGAGTGAVQSVATGTVAGANGISVTAGQYIIGSGLTITGTNAAADATTKGVATFATADFDDNGSGIISLDYTNGQASSASSKGFLTSADWSAFNNKVGSSSLETFVSTYKDWNIVGGALVPTSTIGVIVNASSTIYSLTTLNSTSTNATTTNLYVSGLASTTNLNANTATVGSATAGSLTIGSLSGVVAANSGATYATATGTVSSGAGISVTAGQYIIGSGLTITNTGVTSLAGTANQITASAATGAITLSLPDHVIFPGTFQASAASTTNATSTNLTVTGIASTTALYISNVVADSILKTTTGGLVTAAIAGTDYENALTFSYPLVRTTNTISLAFGTTTSNTWAGTQTFTNAPVLTGFSGVVAANSGTTYSTATGTVTGSSQVSVTAGQSVIGSGLTIDIVGDSIGDTQLAFNTGQNLTTASAPTFSALTVTNALTSGSFVTGNATTTNATTTNIAITGLASTTNLIVSALAQAGTQCVTSNSSGLLSLQTCADFSYPFPSNATSTLLTFSGGLMSTASTTIGGGTQATGLTISGGATTTGNAYFVGNVGIGVVSPSVGLEVSKSTTGAVRASASDLPGTYYAELYGNFSNADLGGVRSSQGNLVRHLLVGSDWTTALGIGDGLVLTSTGNAGVGTSTPYSKLTVWGTDSLFEAVNNASSTIFSIGQGGATTTALSVSGTASTTNLVVSSLGSAGTQCVQVNAIGLLSGTGIACGSGSGGGDSSWEFFNNSGIRLATTSNQVLIGGFATSSAVALLEVAGGNILHIASSSPSLATTSASASKTYDVAVIGRLAYLADFDTGLRIIDVSNPKLTATVGTYSTGLDNTVSVAVANNYAFIGDEFAGIKVLDVTNPASPVLVGSYSDITGPYDLEVSGKYLFAVDLNDDELHIIDISDPANPTVAAVYTSGLLAPYGVAVYGRYAYVASQDNGDIVVVDISNPKNPALAGTYAGSGAPAALYVSGKYLYVADAGAGFYILDVSNPTSPSLVSGSTYDASGAYYGVQVAGNYAYITEHAGTLSVLNVANPQSVSLVGSYSTGGAPWNVTVSGKYAYVAADASGLKVVDINGIETPSAHIGAIETNTANVSDALTVGGDITANGALSVGISGIFSRGTIAAYIASSTQANPVVASFMGGSVGIGTTTPASTLSVQGTGLFSGNLTAANITATGTVTATGNITATNGAVVSVNNSTGNGELKFYDTTDGGGALFAQDGTTYLASVNTGGSWTANRLSINNSTGAITAFHHLTLSGTAANVALGSNYLSGDGDDEGVFVDSTGNVGIGTSTPYSKLTTWGSDGLFEAVNNASSTIFSIGQGGATTTALSVSGTASTTALIVSTLAQATSQCVTSNSGGALSLQACASFDYLFPSNATTTVLNFNGGLTSYASTTIGAGTQAGGLTISGGATTTGNAYFANKVGIGTTSPFATFSIHAGAGQNSFAIGSSSSSYFIVNSTGRVGIGTTTPSSRLAITDTVSEAQFTLAYDATRYATLQTNASGNLVVHASNGGASGGGIILSDDNLWVCQSGSCPSITPVDTSGNLFVENSVYIGADGHHLRQISSTELGLYNGDNELIVTFDEGL